MHAAAATGEALLQRAERTLRTARMVKDSDPDSAVILAYDAARQALTALLAQQGMRATSQGGHYAVECAIRAQFAPGFREFGTWRRRRNEIEYPRTPGGDASVKEAEAAIADASEMIGQAERLIEKLDEF